MTATISTVEPTEITAGDLIQWSRSYSDYPSTSWALTYAFINKTDKFSITATASGTDYAVAIPAVTSAIYNPGVYRWQSYVTNGLQRVTLTSGELTVKPNYATVSTLDTRSQVKQTLDALEAEILARATGGMTEEYTIAGRSLKKSPVKDLIVLRDKYRGYYNSEVNAERVKNGLHGTNRILVRI